MIATVLCSFLSVIHQFWRLTTFLRDSSNEIPYLLFQDGLPKEDQATLKLPTEFVSSRAFHKHYVRRYSDDPDYGGLDISLPAPRKSGKRYGERKTSRRDWSKLQTEREDSLDDSVFEYISPEFQNDEDSAGRKHECYRNNWRSRVYPVCNNFHEFTLERRPGKLQNSDISFLGSGYYREAWIFEQSQAQETSSFVLKKLLLKDGLEMGIEDMSQVQREAIIMERLTASPRVVDIYGHCGISVLLEPMRGESMPFIIPEEGSISQSRLNRIQQKASDVVPMNNLTVPEKLDWALTMAEAIADINGFSGGVIAHADIHPDQFLLSYSGTLKLNDFNMGEILDFNPETNHYCYAHRSCFHRKFVSPEEVRCKNYREELDTYSMGHTIYGLLTGLPPFYQHGDGQFHYYEVKQQIMNRTIQLRPFVDERYRNRSMIEGKLVEIMEECWEWDYRERISIFGVVKMLRKVKEAYKKSGIKI